MEGANPVDYSDSRSIEFKISARFVLGSSTITLQTCVNSKGEIDALWQHHSEAS